MKHGRGYVYDLYYHIVWCVKYRHKILLNDVKDDLIDIIKNICINNNYFNIFICHYSFLPFHRKSGTA